MELLRALAALLEPPGPEHPRLGRLLELGEPPPAEEHLRLFELELRPYASVFLGREGKLGGEARDRIAGFWRALGATPPPEPDHLATLLAAYADLAEDEAAGGSAAERAGHARRAFLWEHLLSWLPAWLAQLQRLAGPFHRGWGGLLTEVLRREAAAVAEPPVLPLALRRAGELADPRVHGGEAFLGTLLAPVTSGLLVTRNDLTRGARELGLGLRAGERAYALKALLAQDAAATLSWLADEAEGWPERHRRAWERCGPRVGAAWAERAVATARLTRELADDATQAAAGGG
ncbi:MAG: molecular chaperone TorD family protein [Thermoanaerobaculia bacterium]|nr:molecular chaperone TorD family protein [Thermoanaerobaculia bacterium]